MRELTQIGYIIFAGLRVEYTHSICHFECQINSQNRTVVWVICHKCDALLILNCLCVCVIVETRHAGRGELTVDVDNGQVPCEITPIPNQLKLYKVSYTSQSYGVRDIAVYFNKLHVTGKVYIMNIKL